MTQPESGDPNLLHLLFRCCCNIIQVLRVGLTFKIGLAAKRVRSFHLSYMSYCTYCSSQTREDHYSSYSSILNSSRVGLGTVRQFLLDFIPVLENVYCVLYTVSHVESSTVFLSRCHKSWPREKGIL